MSDTRSARAGTRHAYAGRGESTVEYRWVPLWHAPLRIAHWVSAFSIVTLVVTGFYIGRPYFMTQGEAVDHFLMGRMRLWHLVSAALLVGAAVLRIYLLAAGNRFERFGSLVPLGRKSLLGLVDTLRYYMLLEPREQRSNWLGHNPLQQTIYTLFYGLLILQILSGFALYSLADPGGLFDQLFGWTRQLPGGIQGVRLFHHMATWAIVTFVPVHVYLGVREDVLDREGTISSILSGGRWVPADEEFEDE